VQRREKEIMDFAQHPDFDKTSPADFDIDMDDPRLDRLPLPDCSFAGCDDYAETGEQYCKECLKVVRTEA